MSRMIVLAGAPEQAKLDWSEKALNPSSHVETVAPSSSETSSGSSIRPSWRQLNTDKLQMRPILPKLNIAPRPQGSADSQITEFFTPSDFVAQESPGSDASDNVSNPSGTSTESSPEGLVDFYDHSFAIHEAIPSSDISSISEAPPQTPVYESSQDMFSPQSDGRGIIRTASQRRLSQAPRPRMLTDLSHIPNAAYINGITPQTMTVDLIVGVLAISPTRKVTTGKAYNRPRQVELVELTVGDDTKTGFNITLWMPPNMHVGWRDDANSSNQEGARSLLRRSLKELRPRDVIMLQHVALSSYRDKVHGQSLKGDVTKIDLLYRKKVDEDDLQGCYSVSNLRSPTDPQVQKVKRVRDWLTVSVGEVEGPSRGSKPKRRKGGLRMMLPDDTQ